MAGLARDETRADETRRRILEAAGPVFADKGFRSATVREICRAAEVNVASVNYHFGDKQRLYVETVQWARQLRAAQVPFPERPARVAAEVELRDFVHTLLSRMLPDDEHNWPARLMLREVMQPTQACRRLVEEYFRPEFERLLTILGRMLPADVPDYRRRQLGFSVIGQCVFYRVAGSVVRMLTRPEELGAHYGIRQLADHITWVVLAALGRAAESAPPSAGGMNPVQRRDRDEERAP